MLLLATASTVIPLPWVWSFLLGGMISSVFWITMLRYNERQMYHRQCRNIPDKFVEHCRKTTHDESYTSR